MYVNVGGRSCRLIRSINHTSPALPLKITQAPWRCFTKDFVSMNGAEVSALPPFLDYLTFGMTFRRQFAAPAIALCLASHYISLIIFSVLLLQCRRKGLDSTEGWEVRRRRVRMQVTLAPHWLSSQCRQRIHCHKAIWSLNPSAVCQTLTLSVACCLFWQLGEFLPSMCQTGDTEL